MLTWLMPFYEWTYEWPDGVVLIPAWDYELGVWYGVAVIVSLEEYQAIPLFF